MNTTVTGEPIIRNRKGIEAFDALTPRFFNGRRGRSRTADLYRVKVALSP